MNKRDENGLIVGQEYKYGEDGFIDWRAMIKDEHLYPNAGYFERFNKPVPESIEGLKDNQLLIKLSGIKDLARLRGFKAVKYDISHLSEQHVVAKCSITWIRNAENEEEVVFEDAANATVNNCSGFTSKFLETIAINRSFVRAVRNFLGIHIVGDDEIDKSDSNYESAVVTSSVAHSKPEDILKAIFESASGEENWEAFQRYLRDLWKEKKYRNEKAGDWQSFADIPPSEVRKIIGIIKSSQK